MVPVKPFELLPSFLRVLLGGIGAVFAQESFFHNAVVYQNAGGERYTAGGGGMLRLATSSSSSKYEMFSAMRRCLILLWSLAQ